MRRDRRSLCMNLMISYIRDRTLPIDKIWAWKLKYQASRYTLIDEVLYRQRHTLLFFIVLGWKIGRLHSKGGAWRNLWKSFRGKIFGLQSLRQDISSQRCTKMHKRRLGVTKVAKVLLVIQRSHQRGSLLYPCHDCLYNGGSTLAKGRGATYNTIVAIDYFTKWEKVDALSKITKKKTTNLIWKNLICKYKIPYALITDNVRQFDNHNFKAFCHNLGIELKFCLPAHPKANGQVEAVNMTKKKSFWKLN